MKREDVKRDEEQSREWETFDEWVDQVPAAITNDTVWRMEVYRLGLFLSDLAWRDAGKLLVDHRTRACADQLFRAASNISSNCCEGYSRGTGKGRAIFYEYALGSARETRDWYFKVRHSLSLPVASHRLELCASVIRLCLTMIREQRRTPRPPH